MATARFARDRAGGEALLSSDEAVGAGVDVRDRGVFLTGDGGKSPCGWERVDTIFWCVELRCDEGDGIVKAFWEIGMENRNARREGNVLFW